MRVLIFHGYLLGGTGSNVYTARLASALVDLGHEVHLLCQGRHPEEHPFVDACGDWDGGELRVHILRRQAPDRSGCCTVYRPDVGQLLPVYVADRYEGIEARPFAECTDEEIAGYIDANVAAVRDVVARVRPDIALANHLVMGPVILARALGGAALGEGASVPYAVKVHGSALEYTVKPEPERFLPYAREGLASARGVLVGSRHTAESLWRALEEADRGGDAGRGGGDDRGGDDGGSDDVSWLRARTRLGPPGVDVDRFEPREPGKAAEGLRALIAKLRSAAPTSAAPTAPGPATGGPSPSAFARDERAAADAMERLQPGEDRIVAFVGKLIAAKGVDLLLAAWPLVLARVPAARLAIVGFGAERERFEMAAAPLGERVVFTGRLDHEELAELLPVCEALIVPSTFAEAFGMVAVEGAACGALPISAAHSGLAEVSDALAQAVPAAVAPLLSFPVDDLAAQAIAQRIVAWLEIDPDLRERTRAALVQTVRERWSWQGVARGVIAAALGELDDLPGP